MGKSTISIAIFNSYVSLPEAICLICRAHRIWWFLLLLEISLLVSTPLPSAHPGYHRAHRLLAVEASGYWLEPGMPGGLALDPWNTLHIISTCIIILVGETHFTLLLLSFLSGEILHFGSMPLKSSKILPFHFLKPQWARRPLLSSPPAPAGHQAQQHHVLRPGRSRDSSVVMDWWILMVYSTHENGKIGDCLLLLYQHVMNVNRKFKIPNGSLIEGVPIKYHMKSLIGGYPHKLYLINNG